VRSDLDEAGDRLFPETIGQAESPTNDDSLRGHDDFDIPTACDRTACQVIADRSGYLQAIDKEALLRYAVEEDLFIHLGYRPGDFITQGCKLVTVWPGGKVGDALSKKINGFDLYFFTEKHKMNHRERFKYIKHNKNGYIGREVYNSGCCITCWFALYNLQYWQTRNMA
jgi:uncharacterized membrane protein